MNSEELYSDMRDRAIIGVKRLNSYEEEQRKKAKRNSDLERISTMEFELDKFFKRATSYELKSEIFAFKQKVQRIKIQRL